MSDSSRSSEKSVVRDKRLLVVVVISINGAVRSNNSGSRTQPSRDIFWLDRASLGRTALWNLLETESRPCSYAVWSPARQAQIVIASEQGGQPASQRDPSAKPRGRSKTFSAVLVPQATLPWRISQPKGQDKSRPLLASGDPEGTPSECV
ncbi:hypothetical protein Dda_7386 [Drechslerella dactyloides]|uniref:Uncharacterized protein n=1 Tax=Drechslerella dactyloides TaxID=74499 RepID=A0AAD6IS46_DREDA|nr:hypothetical protein Dda_7386 [Drechslerella dactyloides]